MAPNKPRKPRSEPSSPMWPSPAIRHALIRPLNPTIDRTPARLKHPSAAKLTITINQPHPDPPKSSTYPNPVDWTDQYSVSALNEWRTTKLRYWLGPKSQGCSRAAVVRYTEEEKEWIRIQGDRKGETRWSEIQGLFEEVFVVGMGRPERTTSQLEGQYRSMRKRVERRGGVRESDEGEDEKDREENGDVSEMDEEEVGLAVAFVEKVWREQKDERGCTLLNRS
ncbi:hypothetical protein G7Y79_00006g018120 [Physcia stellaris]|nr:hypothetical protein G7Y79_00006g018120 [Physcia stellaris]